MRKNNRIESRKEEIEKYIERMLEKRKTKSCREGTSKRNIKAMWQRQQIWGLVEDDKCWCVCNKAMRNV